jgi:hypothetical protein
MADEINTIDVFQDFIDVYELSTEAVQIIEQGPQGPPGDGTLGYYGAFSDYTSQTITSITAAYAMTLNTTDESNGVNRGTPTSKIVFTNAATYNVQWSGQFQNTNNSDHDVRVWLKKNGTDVVGSTGFASIPSSHGQVNGHTIIGWNYILTLAAGDYLQFYWSADSTAVSIQTYSVGSNPTTPSTASLIVTAQQVMNLQVGPTGPQGPAGTAGGISSVALAGTGLSISGSPVTTSGTITANVSYGTTAGTATEGNDARISGLTSGGLTTGNTLEVNNVSGISVPDYSFSINAEENTISSANTLVFDHGINTQGVSTTSLSAAGQTTITGSPTLANSINLRNSQDTGVIEANFIKAQEFEVDSGGQLSFQSGLGTGIVSSTTTAFRTITLPNSTGTVALTQQATDYEVTDSSAGIIMKSPNNSRWRITIDNNGVLLRTALALIFSLSFMCGAKAQVRDLVYGTNNVVVGPTNTNALAFTNSVAFSNPISFGTNAATTRTNLGVSVASNLPAPYSGAATTNSLLTADGAGGSSFVSSRVQRVTLTNNFAVTNYADLSTTNGNVPSMTVDLEASSLYVARWSVILTCGAEGAQLQATAGVTNTNGILNQSVAGRLGRPSFSYGDTYFLLSGTRQTMSLIGFSGAGFTSGVTNGVFNGIAQFRTGASNTTLFWRFGQNTASNVATTLLSNSIFIVEKLSP